MSFWAAAALSAEWNGHSRLSRGEAPCDKQPTGGQYHGGAESYLLLNEEPLENENLQCFHSSIWVEEEIKISLEWSAARSRRAEEAAQTPQTPGPKLN